MYFIFIFLDWRLGFEPTLQLKGLNLRVLQNETHTRTSILTIPMCIFKEELRYSLLKPELEMVSNFLQNNYLLTFVSIVDVGGGMSKMCATVLPVSHEQQHFDPNLL